MVDLLVWLEVVELCRVNHAVVGDGYSMGLIRLELGLGLGGFKIL